MKRLLIVFHSQSGNTARLAEAVQAGAIESGDVEVRCQGAFDTSADDLLAADGLLIGTPENFGTMSGAVKDLFDRTYYPLEGKMVGRPYAIFISAGNDGRGAMAQIERIAKGYGWRQVLPGHIARGAPTEADLAACRELGATLAAGLSVGIF